MDQHTCGRCGYIEGDDAIRQTGLALAEAIMVWARTPQNHGGNPYNHAFVGLAQALLHASGKKDV